MRKYVILLEAEQGALGPGWAEARLPRIGGLRTLAAILLPVFHRAVIPSNPAARRLISLPILLHWRNVHVD